MVDTLAGLSNLERSNLYADYLFGLAIESGFEIMQLNIWIICEYVTEFLSQEVPMTHCGNIGASVCPTQLGAPPFCMG